MQLTAGDLLPHRVHHQALFLDGRQPREGRAHHHGLEMTAVTRYLHLLGDEARRLRRAATARGSAPRSLWQITAIGHLIGALFLRSYARAERVHAAMLARGFDGTAVAEVPAPLVAADYLFMVIVVGVTLAWRISGP